MVMEEGIMRTANYTDLRANLKGYIDSVIDDYDTVIINRGNGKGVVMISLDEYNSLKETEYITRNNGCNTPRRRRHKEWQGDRSQLR